MVGSVHVISQVIYTVQCEHIQAKLPDDIIRNTVGLHVKGESTRGEGNGKFSEHFYLSIYSAHSYLNEADKDFQNAFLFCNFDFNVTKAMVGL